MKNRQDRLIKLKELFFAIIEKKDAVNKVIKSKEWLTEFEPSDIIFLVHDLTKGDHDTNELKTGINKILNVLHDYIRSYPVTEIRKGGLIHACFVNNKILKEILDDIRPLVKGINKNKDDKVFASDLISKLQEFSKVDQYYLIKENVIFPFIEKHVKEIGCLGIMWSFHDDIRKNIRICIELLSSEKPDVIGFNKHIGAVFFNVLAIKFREERILFPYVIDTIGDKQLDVLFKDATEIGFPFYKPKFANHDLASERERNEGEIDLETGVLTIDQIRLLFNHLPVDITFVDENNKVRYFSNPEKRIFTRSKGIIGRDVRNCHPPESVHVVDDIIDCFKAGTKDKATFWIQMKGNFLLIQYFAVRDERGYYKGVVEVSQEINEIRKLEGEQRLLDWK